MNHIGEHFDIDKDWSEFFADGLLAETEKAFLFRVDDRKAWFPKSVVSVESVSKGSYMVAYCGWFEPNWQKCTEEDME